MTQALQSAQVLHKKTEEEKIKKKIVKWISNIVERHAKPHTCTHSLTSYLYIEAIRLFFFSLLSLAFLVDS